MWPVNARRVLSERGIGLVVERHLKSTYLDGAVLLGDDGRAFIDDLELRGLSPVEDEADALAEETLMIPPA